MKLTVCRGCKRIMGAVDKNGKPACAICIGIDPENSIPIEIDTKDEPILCSYCKKSLEQSGFKPPEIPFFAYHPFLSSWIEDTRNAYYYALKEFWKAGGSGDKVPEKAKKWKEELARLRKKGEASAYGHTYYCGCKGWN